MPETQGMSLNSRPAGCAASLTTSYRNDASMQMWDMIRGLMSRRNWVEGKAAVFRLQSTQSIQPTQSIAIGHQQKAV